MTSPTALLIFEIRDTLQLSQGQLGDLLGIAKRTVQRWERGGTTLLPFQIQTLAAAAHPRDQELAARIAAHGGTSLVSLGLERPPAAPGVPMPVSPPAPAALPPLPTATLVDSILCVAADAIGVAPRAIRPALAAAFARAREVRLDVGAVADSLADTAVEPRP